MASLTGQTIASTYDALLKITDNGPITVSLKQITDGLGNNTPLYLSATTVFVDGNFRLSGPLYDTNNNPGTNGQILVSTGSAVDWQNLSESGLITGSGTATFIPKFTSSSAIGSSIISESVSGIGIGITATEKLHVDGNGLFTGTLTASNVSGSNTGDETKASIETKLGAANSSNSGYLTSTDWSIFNAKQAALNGTGFVKISGTTISYDNSTYALASRNIATTAPLAGGGDLTQSRTISIAKATALADGYLSKEDWTSFNAKQGALTLTVNNDSGASSLVGDTLNIPTYTLSGLGGVPSARTITINGETYDLSANRTYSVNVGVTSFNTRTGAVVLSSSDVTTALGYTPALNSRIMTINGVGYDLSADRSWSVGTVTSVGTSAPLTGGTITGTGTIGITQSGAAADGYLSSTDWNTFNNKQNALGYTAENTANKGVANGYASLDGAGKVPSTQLPSYVDDVVEVANYAALPATGETGKIYITLDTNFVYRWSGSVYVKISEPNAVWGSITGTLSNQTDLQNALNAKVSTTRTLTINGTEYDLSANRSWSVGTVTSVSGTGTVSGLSLSGSVTGSGNLTLGGALSLTSSDITTGLGYTPVTNARTLSINGTTFDLTANRSWSVGTVTSVGLALGTTGTDVSVSNSPITSSGDITLNIPTASATNRGALSSTDWSTFNNKQNALTLTTTGNSGSATLVGATLNIPTYTLAGLGGQPLLTNPVTGTGTSGYLTRFTGTSTVGDSVAFDNGTQIGLGTSSPASRLDIYNSSFDGLTLSRAAQSAGTFIRSRSFDTSNTLRTSNQILFGASSGTNTADGFIALSTSNSDVLSERMRITSAGNVGIGTTSPDRKLTISGSDTVLRAVSNTGNVYIQMDSGTTSSYIGQVGNAMYFDNGGSERMRITSSGNVGIGTSTPQARLHSNSDIFTGYFQNGTNGVYDALKVANNTAGNTLSGNAARIQFYNNANNGTTLVGGSIRSVNVDYGWASDLVLSSVQNNGYASQTVNDAIWIKNNGNVGIGATNPADGKLQVGGTSQLGNTICQTYFGVGAAAMGVTSGGAWVIGVDGAAGATERMRITSGGNVLVGATGLNADDTGVKLFGQSGSLLGTIAQSKDYSSGTILYTSFETATPSANQVGSITYNGSAVAYNTSSDYRLKQDFKDYNGLSIVDKIKTYDYEWKSNGSRSYGVIAHELEEVLPYAVVGEKDGEQMQGVDYSKIVPILVKAIQEQQQQIEELKAKLK